MERPRKEERKEKQADIKGNRNRIGKWREVHNKGYRELGIEPGEKEGREKKKMEEI